MKTKQEHATEMGTPDIEVVSENKCRARITCRNRWGRWVLSTSQPISLNISPFSDSDTAYYVTLSEIDSDGIQDWLQHLREKTWITPIDIFDFHDACAALKKRGFIKTEGRQKIK